MRRRDSSPCQHPFERDPCNTVLPMQRGSILVLTLLITLVLTGLGLTTMWVTSSSRKLTGNATRRAEALNAAETGLEQARNLLTTFGNWNTLLAGCTGGASDSIKGVSLCAANQPLHNVRVVEASSATDTSVSGLGLITYSVWIRNDEEEGLAAADTDTRVIVRSEGTGRDGLSAVALETVFLRTASSTVSESSYSQSGMSATGSNSAKAALTY